MNLINQLFFAVLISSATSTLMIFVWWLLRGFFMVTNAKLIYLTLRWTGIMYLLPIGYIAVLVTYRKWFQGQSRVWELVFIRAGELTDKLCIAAFIWFAAAVFLIASYMAERSYWNRKLADNILEDDPVITRVYRYVCTKLGIQPEKLVLYRNVEVNMPCIIGWIHPQVILPEQDYTEEELELIFFHELSHHKHKDLRYKSMVAVVVMVHCFNPFSYFLLRKVNFWSECMADVLALEASGNLHHAKRYFDKIVNLIPDSDKKQVDGTFVSTLCKSKKMIDRRVDFMIKYQKVKSAGKVVTAALAMIFVLASGTTAYASGKTVADLHNVIYQKTENFVNVKDEAAVGKMVVAEDGLIEYHCKIEDLDKDGLEIVYSPDEDIATIVAGVHYNFDWQVNPNTRHVSGPYTIDTNQKVAVSCTVTPMNKVYCLGIMDDHGNAYYVRGTGGLSHNFSIPERSRYRVFVQNDYTDGTILHATGYFAYEDK